MSEGVGAEFYAWIKDGFEVAREAMANAAVAEIEGETGVTGIVLVC